MVESFHGLRKCRKTQRRGAEGTEVEILKKITLRSQRLCGEYFSFFGCGSAALGSMWLRVFYRKERKGYRVARFRGIDSDLTKLS
jgi:hypothetical protein